MRSSQVTKRLKCLGVGIFQSLLLLLLVTTGWAAPLVTDMQPPDGSTQPVTTTVTATFSEAMNPATITNGSFTVARAVGIKAIAAGYTHTVVLKDDGTVAAWGSGSYGQNTVPAGLSGVTAIAAGSGHSVALKADGTVVVWGEYWNTKVPAGLSDVVAIAAGGSHTVALKDDGTVVAWGGAYANAATPANSVPAGLADVVAIAAGGLHTVALKVDGTVVAWGDNRYGQTTVPTGLTGVAAIAAGQYNTVALKGDGTVIAWGYNTATVPEGLSGVTAIAAGGWHTMAMKGDGTLVAWGVNTSGQTTVPVGIAGVTAIAAGWKHTVVLKDDGTVVAWGDNKYGATTVPTGFSGGTAIAARGRHTVALKSNGTVVAWGDNTYGQTSVPAGLSGVRAIAAGGWHTVALKNDGTVVAWGRDNYFQTNSGLSGVTAIAAGAYHTVALKSDGTVAAWGYNLLGQTSVPSGLTGVTAIAAGDYHTVALKADGTVVAWGANHYGAITVPAGLSGVIAIAAGYAHTVALKNDGTVVTWGLNSSYQSTVPAGLTGVIAIAAGSYHTVALKGDGTVVTWGGHSNVDFTVPVGLSGVVAIAAGFIHTVVLKVDGSVVAWGDNTNGQLAVPSSPYETPVAGAVVYDQSADTATFTPLAPLAPNYNYLATVNTGARNAAGGHLAADVRWSFTSEDAIATITLSDLVQPYDGTPKTVNATTDPAGLTVVITYNGSTTPPTAIGSYTVVATVSDIGYPASSSATLTITEPTHIVGVSVLGGNGDIQCESPVVTGENSLCTITPAANYHLETFSDNNVDQLGSVSGNTYTLSNVVADHAIAGTFAINLRADAGPDQNIACTGPSGAQVTLDGAASIGAATSTWSGPFGTVSGVSPIVTIPLGTHTLTLTVADSVGRTASDIVVVTVYDNQPPQITITGVADGMTYNLGLVPQPAYSASDAQSGIAASSGVITGTPDAFGCGTFTYTVTATDGAGNTAVASVTFEVKATPQGTSALIDALVNTGLIPAQTAATLLDSLARALSAYSSDPNLGDNMVNTFQNQINAALQSGKIDAATAALLNTAANYIVTNN